jgi:predicted kinase
LVIVGPTLSEPVQFADRVVEERGAAISLRRVRELLAGRVQEGQIEERSLELLTNAVSKRLAQNETVVVPIEGFDRAERERYTRMAHQLRRPRHLILLDAGRDQVSDDERPALDELRRAVDAAEVGQEGFQTALRLGGNARSELKRIVFQPPPRED